jgi:hypothetical protein
MLSTNLYFGTSAMALDFSAYTGRKASQFRVAFQAHTRCFRAVARSGQSGLSPACHTP